MSTFISAHLKRVLTLAFVFGVVSLAVNLVDKRLSKSAKARFDAWINERSPKLNRVGLERIYGYLRSRPKKYSAAVALVFAPLAVDSIIRSGDIHVVPLELLGAFALYFFLFWLYCFWIFEWVAVEPTIWRAAKRYWKTALQICILVVFMGVIGDLYMAVSGKWLVNGDISGSLAVGVFAGPFLVIGLSLPLFVPILLIWLISPPIRATARTVRWLSSYPDGPWAGLVWAITLITGLFRLFL